MVSLVVLKLFVNYESLCSSSLLAVGKIGLNVPRTKIKMSSVGKKIAKLGKVGEE